MGLDVYLIFECLSHFVSAVPPIPLTPTNLPYMTKLQKLQSSSGHKDINSSIFEADFLTYSVVRTANSQCTSECCCVQHANSTQPSNRDWLGMLIKIFSCIQKESHFSLLTLLLLIDFLSTQTCLSAFSIFFSHLYT